MSEGQSSYMFVCADELAKSEGVELPAEEDGNLLLSVLQSQFEGASGLKYRQVDQKKCQYVVPFLACLMF